MPSSATSERSFETKLEGTEQGRVYVVLPFDPERAWGSRPRYHITGTINGMRVRGALERCSKGYFLPLGPAYRRAASLSPGDPVALVIIPEGPQRESLAGDIAAALTADPEAMRFFDGLATFYRKNLLRWVEGTRHRPEVRAERIAELVALMKAGKKERES